MKLVYKKNHQKTVRSLTQDECRRLKCYANDNLSSEDKPLLEQLMNQCRDLGYWILCDCDQEKEVLMTVVRREGGLMYLARLHRYDPHHDSCPFKTNNAYQTPGKQARSRPINLKKNLDFFKKGELIENKDNTHTPRSKHQSSGGKRQSKLSRLMYTMLFNAGLSEYSLDYPPITEQYKAIRKAMDDTSIANKLAFNTCFWTHPHGLTSINERLNKLSYKFLPKASPHGFGLFIADKVDVSELYLTSSEGLISLSIEGELMAVSGRMSKTDGPFLCMVAFSDCINENEFVAINAYVTPVASRRHLMPMDSRYERLVFNQLMQKLQYYWQAQKKKVIIEKPLFDRVDKYNQEVRVRPDFILKIDNRQCVLEVGGSHEDDYLSRKKIMHEHMGFLGPVFNFDALAAEKSGQFNQALNRTLNLLFKTLIYGS